MIHEDEKRVSVRALFTTQPEMPLAQQRKSDSFINTPSKTQTVPYLLSDILGLRLGAHVPPAPSRPQGRRVCRRRPGFDEGRPLGEVTLAEEGGGLRGRGKV